MTWRRLPPMAPVLERAAKASIAHIEVRETPWPSLTCLGCGQSMHLEANGGDVDCHVVPYAAGFLPARDAFALWHSRCAERSHDTHAAVA